MKQPLTAIILAGGLGTRLRSVVPDLPKCMAPVAGKPFITYVIAYLQSQGVTHFIFSLGYLHNAFEDTLRQILPQHNYTVVIEDEPLGTGGAIQLACKHTDATHVLITNGDTLFKANIGALIQMHQQHNATITLALKPMHQFDRYGVVATNEEHRITAFQEKQWYDAGLINGGLYYLTVNDLLQLQLPTKYSFEKAFLEAYYQQCAMYGCEQDAYFIDIGIPSDFERAQQELA